VIFIVSNSNYFSELKYLYINIYSQKGFCVRYYFFISVWLVIISIEFFIFSTIILPRLYTLVVSKQLTKKLINNEVKLFIILNSQFIVLLLTQAKYSLIWFFFWRLLILVIVTAVSILYKFFSVGTNKRGIILEYNFVI
jgi:hypothetical protein